jgi:hypothetical protein
MQHHIGTEPAQVLNYVQPSSITQVYSTTNMLREGEKVYKAIQKGQPSSKLHIHPKQVFFAAF